MPEFRWLRSFLAVAEEQHFSRAARRLNLAQPALTAHIQQLEAALGSTLFERTNRMGGLTPAGRALLPEAEAIVNRAEALQRKVREVAHGESGLLRLGVIPPAATTAAADSLRRLTQELPGVELQVQQGYQDRLEHLLLDGDLDLVLGRPPENKTLAHRRLFVEQQGVLMRADDELAKAEIVPLRELGGLRLVLLRGNPHFGQNFLDLAEHLGLPRLDDDRPRIGHREVRDLVEVRRCAVVVDHYVVKDAQRRSAGPDGGELPLQGFVGLVHLVVGLLDKIVHHSSITSRRPASPLARLPRSS